MDNIEIQSENMKSGKKLLIPLVIVSVLMLLGAASFKLFKSETNEIENTSEFAGGLTNTSIAGSANEDRLITLAEIAQHNTRESCWTSIDGGVFDVTKFISTHKGGDKILNACGIDATELFTGKSPLGRVHSQMAVKILSGMKIGILQK